jgi:hypothetical protein
MKKRTRCAAPYALAALSGWGCAGEQASTPVVDIPPQPATVKVAADPPAPPPERPKPKEVAGGIGVAECDAYFEALERCFAKNPALDAAMREAMTEQRTAWRDAAKTQAVRDSLKTSCAAALDAIENACQ